MFKKWIAAVSAGALFATFLVASPAEAAPPGVCPPIHAGEFLALTSRNAKVCFFDRGAHEFGQPVETDGISKIQTGFYKGVILSDDNMIQFNAGETKMFSPPLKAFLVELTWPLPSTSYNPAQVSVSDTETNSAFGLNVPGAASTAGPSQKVLDKATAQQLGPLLGTTGLPGGASASFGERGKFGNLIEVKDASAPTRYEYPVQIPAGATAVIEEDGSVGFYDGSAEQEPLGGIGEPWAVDDNGKDVPTHFEMQGNKLIQVIEHNQPGVAYPVVADPHGFWGWANCVRAVVEVLAANSILAIKIYKIIRKAKGIAKMMRKIYKIWKKARVGNKRQALVAEFTAVILELVGVYDVAYNCLAP